MSQSAIPGPVSRGPTRRAHLKTLWPWLAIAAVLAVTAAVGYQGDTVANSLGDILSCVAGFALAQRLSVRLSVVLFFVMEGVLLLWIRDDLFLSVVMLLYPIPGIKAWQMGN